MARIAAAGADRRVTGHAHRIGRKACDRVGVAVAALDSRHWNVRRRFRAGRGGAVVAARAVGIGRCVRELPARPAGESRGRAGVAGDAITPAGCDVSRERRRALRARRSLTRERAVVAGIAPAGADGAVAGHAHRIGRKTRRGVGMAAAALDTRHWNVRRRFHAGRGGAVVAARAVGIGRCVRELPARPAGESRGRAGVAGDAITPAGCDVARERRRALRARRSLTRERAVVAGIAPAGADGAVAGQAHRVGRKTRRGVGMAAAALDTRHWNVRWRFHAGRGGAIVATGAIGVGCRVSEFSARPTGERRSCAGVAGNAVAAIGGDVTGEGCRALRTVGAFPGERAVVAGVAAAGADCRVARHAHGIGCEIRSRVGVAIAALNSGHRHMRWRLHTGCGGAVVAARAIGIGRRMGELPPCPAGEARRSAGVTADAVAAIGRDVAWIGRSTDGAGRSLAVERAVVTGIASAGADGRMAGHPHRVGDKTRRGVGVAVAALNPGHRDMRRRLHTGCGGAVVATRAIGVGRRVGEFPARPTGEARSRAGVTDPTIAAIGRDMARIGCRADGTRRSLSGERAVVTGIAAAGADGGVAGHAHRIGDKTHRCIGVAAAALNSGHRNVRRCLHAGCGGAVVTARAIGVGGRMGELATRPAGERRSRTGVATGAITPAGRNMAGERCGTDGTGRSLAGERAVVAGIAAAGADGAVTGHAHRVGGKTRRRVGVAAAALDSRHRDVRRRLHTGRGGAVVTVRAIGIGRGVGKLPACPAGKGRGCAGVAGGTVTAVGRNMARERGRS